MGGANSAMSARSSSRATISCKSCRSGPGAAEPHGAKRSAETPQNGGGARTASHRPRRGGDRHQQGVKTLPGRSERSTSPNRVIHLSGSNQRRKNVSGTFLGGVHVCERRGSDSDRHV